MKNISKNESREGFWAVLVDARDEVVCKLGAVKGDFRENTAILAVHIENEHGSHRTAAYEAFELDLYGKRDGVELSFIPRDRDEEDVCYSSEGPALPSEWSHLRGLLEQFSLHCKM